MLIEHSDPTLRKLSGSRPLLVSGQYGSGRTVYMGFNGTWRWRKVGRNAEFFKQFWNQATQYLIKGRSLEGQRRGYIEAEKSRYQLGDQVMIVARELKDENFEFYEMDEVTVRIEAAGQSNELQLQRVPERDGVYQAAYTTRSVGQHVVRLELPAGTVDQPPRIDTAFSVTQPTVETNEVALDKSLFGRSGGGLGRGLFRDRPDRRFAGADPRDHPRERTPQQAASAVGHRIGFLLLLVLLLTVEWAVPQGIQAAVRLRPATTPNDIPRSISSWHKQLFRNPTPRPASPASCGRCVNGSRCGCWSTACVGCCSV